MSRNRIDVHAHFVPPFWGDALPGHGGDPSGWALPPWTPDEHLRFMDDHEIATSVLSLSAPAVVGWRGEQRRELARQVNEYCSELGSRYSRRFGNFATVPLPDVEGAVEEAEYALDHMRADGVVLLTNYDGVYLGDDRYAPLWSCLDERSAVVFIHPGHPQIASLPGVPGPLVDYPFDTTRNAVHMVVNGVLDRYPNMTVILSHAGGFLPYAALRFGELHSALNPDGPSADELLTKFQRFHFDTALSSGPYAFGALMEFTTPDKVLFGSDYPYAPAAVAGAFTEILDTRSGVTEEQATAIDRGNAEKLFGRFAD